MKHGIGSKEYEAIMAGDIDILWKGYKEVEDLLIQQTIRNRELEARTAGWCLLFLMLTAGCILKWLVF